jgi:hypothetical protein
MKKKRIFACAMTALLLATTSWADDKEKDEDRLKNAGTIAEQHGLREAVRCLATTARN